MKIAWIGTGVMGKSMAANLQKCGHTLTLFNRTAEKAKQIAAELGMHVASSIAEAVRDVDAVFTIVGYPEDVKEVMLGEGGVFEHAPTGCLIVDMTTSLPSLAVTLHEEAKARRLRLLDAPVSGGDAGAKNATLSI
ncbi:MAG TPA: NAD(P)-binding domain-containing protein, partial [Fastidiosipila sp.]|nr:NAD(P)-binding domain-containing protein [Fastidiosipila sp.]